jgi:serine/threonine-protein kinase
MMEVTGITMDHATQTPSSAAGNAVGSDKVLDLSGKTLGDFHLRRRLGQGGMGQVYLADQISLKRKVAVKIMRTDAAVNATSLERFRAEAEAVARVNHANVVQVYAIGQADGMHFMALEYVEGRNLREYLALKGPPDAALAISVMRQAAAGLQRASELGVVHRDIKPENILLTRRGEVKVADFGLSRCFDGEQPAVNLTQSGMTMGTPLYMSPEQIQGLPIDARTDIYSLGVTCYHLLAGEPPFRGKTPFELAVQHVKQEPEPLAEIRPDLPPELCAIVHKMMAKAPEERYASGAELLKDLARVRDRLAGLAKEVPLTFTEMGAVPVGMGTNTPANEFATLTTPLVPAKAMRQPRFSWKLRIRRRYLFALSLFLALLAGGGLAWLRGGPAAAGGTRGEKSESPLATSLSPVATGGDAPLLAEPNRHEMFLRALAAPPKGPVGDRARREMLLRHCVELAVFYLQKDRLDEADRFFNNDLAYRRMRGPRVLGRLGHAIVLGLQNRAAESTNLFLEVLRDKTNAASDSPLRLLLEHPHLRYQISRALEANQTNEPRKPLPAELDKLRVPPKLSTR